MSTELHLLTPLIQNIKFYQLRYAKMHGSTEKLLYNYGQNSSLAQT